MSEKIDETDSRILRELQIDSGRSQRELAERVGLSQNALWRRLKLLESRGIVTGQVARLNRTALGHGLVVFAMVRTRSHSAAWLRKFRQRVASIPAVIDFYRISGDYDYLLKVVTTDIASYDRVYQQMIEDLELETVTSYFAMECIAENRPIPV